MYWHHGKKVKDHVISSAVQSCTHYYYMHIQLVMIPSLAYLQKHPLFPGHNLGFSRENDIKLHTLSCLANLLKGTVWTHLYGILKAFQNFFFQKTFREQKELHTRDN